MALDYFSVTTSMPRSGAVAAAGDRATDTTARRFLQAIDALEAGRWSEGFLLLSALANEGHPPSARIASMLPRRGTSLFGGTFAATRQEKAYWDRIGEQAAAQSRC